MSKNFFISTKSFSFHHFYSRILMKMKSSKILLHFLISWKLKPSRELFNFLHYFLPLEISPNLDHPLFTPVLLKVKALVLEFPKLKTALFSTLHMNQGLTLFIQIAVNLNLLNYKIFL